MQRGSASYSKEATKLPKSIFAILQAMDVAVLEDEELGTALLTMADRQAEYHILRRSLSNRSAET